MKRSDATSIIGIMAAGFHRESLEPETVVLWVSVLEQMDDTEAAREAALAHVMDGSRFPTIKDFRGTYRAKAEARRAPALEEPEGPRVLPDEAREFLARIRGENTLNSL